MNQKVTENSEKDDEAELERQIPKRRLKYQVQDEQKGKQKFELQNKKLRKQIRMAELLTSAFAFIGMMAGYMEQEYLFVKNEKKERYSQSFTCLVLRWIQTLSTFFLFGYLQSKYFKQLVLEFILCIIHNPPYIDKIVRADQMGKQLRTQMCDKICAKVGIDADVIFALKASFKKHTFLLLGVSFFIATYVFGLAVQLFERPYYDDTDLEPIAETDPIYQDYELASNGMWLVVVTMTTVGFGDYFPRTHMGRLIMVGSTFVGLLLISMTIVSLQIFKKFQNGDFISYTILYRIQTKKQVQVKASNFITSFYRLRLLKRNASLPGFQEDQAFMKNFKYQKIAMIAKFENKMDEFYKARLKLKSKFLGEAAFIRAVIGKIDSDMGMIGFIISSIKEIQIEVDSFVEIQQDQIIKLREMHRNFKILNIITNRFNPEGPSQTFFLQSQKAFVAGEQERKLKEERAKQMKKKRRRNGKSSKSRKNRKENQKGQDQGPINDDNGGSISGKNLDPFTKKMNEFSKQIDKKIEKHENASNVDKLDLEENKAQKEEIIFSPKTQLQNIFQDDQDFQKIDWSNPYKETVTLDQTKRILQQQSKGGSSKMISFSHKFTMSSSNNKKSQKDNGNIQQSKTLRAPGSGFLSQLKHQNNGDETTTEQVQDEKNGNLDNIVGKMIRGGAGTIGMQPSTYRLYNNNSINNQQKRRDDSQSSNRSKLSNNNIEGGRSPAKQPSDYYQNNSYKLNK
eukprot:403362010